MAVESRQANSRWRWLRLLLLLLALGGVAAAVAGVLSDPQRFFQSYLVAFLYWIGISFGCLGWLLLHNMTGSRWGFAVQRVLEAGTRTLPLMALLFVPLLFGLSTLYPWSTAAEERGEILFLAKSSYLNVPFFVVRAVIYFAVCIGLAWIVTRWSNGADEATSEDPRAVAQIWQDRVRFSAVALLLFAVAVNFAAIDWLMSLEPHWFSSLFGWLAIGRHALGGLVFAILMLALVRPTPRAEPLRPLLTPQALNDMGTAFLAALLSWAYLALMQFMVIWTANIPEEVTYYLQRTRGGWIWVVVILALVYVALPTLLLLVRPVKRRFRLLGLLAALVLILHLLHTYWLVMPVFQPTIALHWLDLALPTGMGGLWLAVFGWQLLSRPLLPANHPKARQLLAERAHSMP